MRTFILLAFLCIGCESYQDLTICNHTFDGTIYIDVYEQHLNLGEQFTIPIDEGVYDMEFIGDEVHKTREKTWREGISDNVVVHKGHNEYVIRLPTTHKQIIEP